MDDEIELILTSGYNYSIAAQLLAELLIRNNIKVKGVLLANNFSIKRIKKIVYSYGFENLTKKIYKSIFYSPNKSSDQPLDNFLKDIKFKPLGLSNWCKANAVNLCKVKNLNSNKALEYLKKIKPNGVVYCGGGILSKNFLSQSGFVLNAHAGPLPEIRGMNAAEWSFLLGMKQEVTIHFIDEGIDTGQVIKSLPYSIKNCKSINQIRDISIITGIKGLINILQDGSIFSNSICTKDLNKNLSRQCFVMSPLIRSLCQNKLDLYTNELS